MIVNMHTYAEESLDRHRTSCAFCSRRLEILHPIGDRTFICGNEVGVAPRPAKLLKCGKPLGLGTPSSSTMPSSSGMPAWMPSREDAIKAWDDMWASNENALIQVLHMLPSNSQ